MNINIRINDHVLMFKSSKLKAYKTIRIKTDQCLQPFTDHTNKHVLFITIKPKLI